MKQIDNKKEENKIIERPRICCIDLEEEFVSILVNSGTNIYSGTLGAKIKVSNKSSYDNHKILPNYNLPSNIHEYDIIIVDLDNYKTIGYNEHEHKRTVHTGFNETFFRSTYPETLFDPRPYSSSVLKTHMNQITNRRYLVIVFSSKSVDVVYELIKVSSSDNDSSYQRHNIYDFINKTAISDSKSGSEIIVCEMKNNLKNILEKYREGATYNQTFLHPNQWKQANRYMDNDRAYFPLMENINGDVVSYIESSKCENLIVLPQIKNKGSFLLELLSNFAPLIYPELFPNSTTFSWKNEQEYWLPNHSILLENKSNIQKEYEEKILKCDNDIKENLENFSFLHELLTETGDTLVKSIITFLKWLEFDNVIDLDEVETDSSILEEDIQVELSEGLLVIECKGIGRTSKDSECSQISKIKFRRCKERSKFDVYALYIVNHQKHLPPLQRQNPPFQENQIKDAINEERGLLTTWQLYNLYFDITNGIITKEEARQSLLGYGIIEFRPKNLTKIYEPTEFFKNETVCIAKVEDLALKVGDKLFVENDSKFELVEILGIKENEVSVQQASNGELGLELSSRIKKKSILWKRF